jgi:hypothetical protein
MSFKVLDNGSERSSKKNNSTTWLFEILKRKLKIEEGGNYSLSHE